MLACLSLLTCLWGYRSSEILRNSPCAHAFRGLADAACYAHPPSPVVDRVSFAVANDPRLCLRLGRLHSGTLHPRRPSPLEPHLHTTPVRATDVHTSLSPPLSPPLLSPRLPPPPSVPREPRRSLRFHAADQAVDQAADQAADQAPAGSSSSPIHSAQAAALEERYTISYMAFGGLGDGGLRPQGVARLAAGIDAAHWSRLGRMPKLTRAQGHNLGRELRLAQTASMRGDAAGTHVLRGAGTDRGKTKCTVPAFAQSTLRASRKGGVAGPASGSVAQLRSDMASERLMGAMPRSKIGVLRFRDHERGGAVTVTEPIYRCTLTFTLTLILTITLTLTLTLTLTWAQADWLEARRGPHALGPAAVLRV
jgi:hypothetical protein